uniref:Suppressor of white apricot N-terminal domain-containing protein n=1 Tax=Polytomella parva TaxID=51329 RepID=A0A7S0VJR2_9CHLO|mmetsp:Transcript_7612/g.14931  ORF Transcript_7612/g.14931 Transcript_7612/m.14931 type:complete len:120 (+) Transcript_7612:122-481(+)
MASYYHDTRAHAKKIKELQDETKRRAERKAEIAISQNDHPLNSLWIEGRSCKIVQNSEQYDKVENNVGLFPWNGQFDNLIDRFDGRSLLDFYNEPDDFIKRRPRSEQEDKLEKVCMNIT